MPQPFYPAPLVLLDLETTGANPSLDRITEVGLIQINPQQVDGEGIATWSSLVNPCQAIPHFIQRLTGIDDAMVAAAPLFAELAPALLEKLKNRVFVAHNARFDYTFLRNEFKRLGLTFRAKVLCTVQLSRKLYPDEFKHSLDALIARHGLEYHGERHRALTDAELIYQFLQAAVKDLGAERVQQAIDELIRPPALPPQIDESVLDDLPDTAGVYVFYGENDEALWIGSSPNIRRRVLQHFGKKANEGPAAYLARDLRRIDWIETSGDLGSALLERKLIQELRPRMNPVVRQKVDQTQSVWEIALPTLSKAVRGEEIAALQPKLLPLSQLATARGELFGPFRGAREAQNIMNRIIKGQGLCRQVLGLEAPRKDGGPCTAYLQGDCRGACIGREAMGLHNGRLLAALAKHKLAPWPYTGAIAISEGPEWAPVLHVIDNWCYLGQIHDLRELPELIASSEPAYDVDMAKLIRSEIKKQAGKIQRL
ncbi:MULTISPECIES: exonuclease domain-containing protein [Deefgea]|uniref:DNA-directed DNA polymerase n=1 Tax=Deefgea chitinilytica TaxID=570276 RepID=A0ABS2CD79_9NEIS|nr:MULTISPECIES: exonuclease domain-containing protein [Deefgea]MBM5572002.1 ethanolamine utilization protein [Deefgea chitinilytica]MBM9889237.1 GIY-YIG nuclease family protein [Deefgea sp. CFH1-16]